MKMRCGVCWQMEYGTNRLMGLNLCAECWEEFYYALTAKSTAVLKRQTSTLETRVVFKRTTEEGAKK